MRAGRAILEGIGTKSDHQLAPQVVYHDIIEDLSDQHAIILNRSREASILVPGDSLLVFELAPALFACVAANEAERAAPDAVLNDVQMIGATGRIFMSGRKSSLEKARQASVDTLSTVRGRPSKKALVAAATMNANRLGFGAFMVLRYLIPGSHDDAEVKRVLVATSVSRIGAAEIQGGWTSIV